MTTRLQPAQTKDAQVFPNVSWEQFEQIEHSFEAIPGVRFRYLDGQLEIMTISSEHEDFKSTIALLIEAYMRVKKIRFYKRGGPSLGDRAISARSEPDESCNINILKPFPDLVIEVVISSGGINKLEGYRRMQVQEVWFWEDGVFTIYQLQADEYQQVKSSKLLNLLPLDLLSRYVTYHDQYDAVEEFTAEIVAL